MVSRKWLGLVAAVVLVSACYGAMTPKATQWYILNAGNNTCDPAAQLAAQHGTPWAATPYGLRMFAREHMSSFYAGTKITRLGTLGIAVEIEIKNEELVYFSQKRACEAAERIEAKQLKELQ